MAYYNASWNEYQDACERVLRWMVTNKGEKPLYVMVGSQQFSPAEYEDAVIRVQQYLTKNKTKPKTVRFGAQPTQTWDGIYREQPYKTLKQPDKYSCGSNTAANILSTFGIQTTDTEMRKYCRTGTHGTNPQDLIDGVLAKLKDSGFKNSRCDVYNTSDLAPNHTEAMNKIGHYMADPNHAVACLINTEGWGWRQYYTGIWEHWVSPVEINTKKKTVKVNDPARSFLLQFTYNEFMSGISLVSRKSWYVFVARK